MIQDDAETLYVSRPVLNGAAIRHWATSQGFDSALSNDDLHVTVAFSKTPISWQQFTPQHNRLTMHGGSRSIKKLGDKGAVVLTFLSERLLQRWTEFREGGASWDYDGYHPHITISYKGKVDLATIQPYQGDLIFGPEKFGKVEDDWDTRSVNEEPLVTSNTMR